MSTEPASYRISGYPYLVQRLKHHEPRGNQNNIGRYFDFDYMGSAEFEFGAIPNAKKALLAMTPEEFEPVEITEGAHKAWYVGPKAHMEMVRVWFREELANDYTGMKERSNLKGAYTAPNQWSPNGWFCVDGGWQEGLQVWGLFTTESYARDFVKGLRGTP